MYSYITLCGVNALQLSRILVPLNTYQLKKFTFARAIRITELVYFTILVLEIGFLIKFVYRVFRVFNNLISCMHFRVLIFSCMYRVFIKFRVFVYLANLCSLLARTTIHKLFYNQNNALLYNFCIITVYYYF